MVLTKEQRDSLMEAARPLIRWINDNGHSHVTVLVECDRAVVREDLGAVQNAEFIKD